MSFHATATVDAPSGDILLVGHPNVGKSALFQRLTGLYVTVSNYPGTTVDVAFEQSLGNAIEVSGS